jgi:hypothetical protein
MDELLFGIPVPALILLLIEALKYVGLIKTSDHARMANIVLGSVCAVGLVLVANIPEVEMTYLTIVISGLWNIIIAALAYNKTLGAYRDQKALAELQSKYSVTP